MIFFLMSCEDDVPITNTAVGVSNLISTDGTISCCDGARQRAHLPYQRRVAGLSQSTTPPPLPCLSFLLYDRQHKDLHMPD